MNEATRGLVDCYQHTDFQEIQKAIKKTCLTPKIMKRPSSKVVELSLLQCDFPIELAALKNNVVLTIANSIDSPIILARQRPKSTIIAIMLCKKPVKILNFYRNIFPIFLPDFSKNTDSIGLVINFAKTIGLLSVGDVFEFNEGQQSCDVFVGQQNLVFHI